MSAKKNLTPYAQKLLDPRWQRKRLEILNRDDFTCQCCYSKENTLHVHHALYLKGRDPWEYENTLLVTYCEDCHKAAEEDRDAVLRSMANPMLAGIHSSMAYGLENLPGYFSAASAFTLLMGRFVGEMTDSRVESIRRVMDGLIDDIKTKVNESTK